MLIDIKTNYMTVPAAVRELEKIEMICIANETYKMDHALTVVQKNILNAFKIDTTDIKREVEKISTKLRYKMLKTKK